MEGVLCEARRAWEGVHDNGSPSCWFASTLELENENRPNRGELAAMAPLSNQSSLACACVTPSRVGTSRMGKSQERLRLPARDGTNAMC